VHPVIHRARAPAHGTGCTSPITYICTTNLTWNQGTTAGKRSFCREHSSSGWRVHRDTGNLTFVTIFPGCYSGRWPHAHFEVYGSIDEATDGRDAIKTSQLAMPADARTAVFAATGNVASVRNFAQISLASDNVFSDGADDQLPTITGSVADGFIARLVVRV
jgi:protocatechuate 3,4-dioxygenase beta subunit